MKFLARIIAILAVLSSAAFAQQGTQLPAGAFWGNPTGSRAPGQPVQFIPLGSGGLGGSQAGATAGQVPSFPGAGGPAVPTSLFATNVTQWATCDGTTIDTANLQTALNSGNSVLAIPKGVTCVAAASVTVPPNVTFSIAGTLKLPTVSQTTTGATVVSSPIVLMTTTTGVVAGMGAYDQTLGYQLPGTVSSVTPSTSVTMTAAVGNSGSVATSSSTASGSATLSFTSLTGINAQNGMTVYDVTQSRTLPGTISSGTPYSSTTVVMTLAVGGSGVGSGDTLTFGYPVSTSDVIVFSTFNGSLILQSSNSTVNGGGNIDEGNYAGINSAGISPVSGATFGWVSDNIHIINGGLYGWVYTNATNYRISNSGFTVNVPSNKNNNEAILSFCSGSTPGGSSGRVLNNRFAGAGTDQCEYAPEIAGNEIFNFKYGAGITCSSSQYSSLFNIHDNKIHDSSGTDSNLTVVEGIECWSSGTLIHNNTIYRNGGGGIAVGGNSENVSNNFVYDNGQSVAETGISCLYIGPSEWQNCNGSVFTGNISTNINGTTQSYGYDDNSASIANVVLNGNTFEGALGTTSISSTSTAQFIPSGANWTIPGALTVGGAITGALGTFTVGSGTGQPNFNINGGASGNGNGPSMAFQYGGTGLTAMGSYSGIYGGSTPFNSDFTFYVGTTTNDQIHFLIGGTENLQINTSGIASSLANVATTSAVCFNTTSHHLTYDGTLGTCTTSDERLKNMGPRIPNALEKLLKINGVYYTWKDPAMGKGRQIGMGAQTVERVFPELVQTDSHGTKSLDYQRLTAPIIEAIRELKADNDNLRHEVEQLKWRVR